MNRKSMLAEEYFQNYNCCQSVLMALSDDLDITVEQAKKIAAGFGAGMGYQGLTCGAVVGAYMAIGLKAGEVYKNSNEVKEKSYQLIKEYNNFFTARYGSIVCSKLLQVDLSTNEGVEKAKSEGLFDSKCPHYVKGSVQIIEEMFKNLPSD